MARFLFTIASGDFAGGSRMAFHYAQAFLSAGHEVIALCGPRPANRPSVLDALQKIGVNVWEGDGFRRTLDVPLILQVARVAQTERADAIVSTLQADVKIAAAAGALAHLPVVAFVQNTHTFGGNFLWRKLKETVYGFALRKMTRLAVCLSESSRNELTARFNVRPEHVAILANGIDLREHPPQDARHRAAVRKDLGLHDADILLMNVGRFDEQKGQLVLLDAFQRIAQRSPETKLLLVGSATDTPESDAYAQRIDGFIQSHRLRDRVLTPGWRADVRQLLRAADLYVHSALWEGGPLPLAMLEAMAAELPVIGTDCAGIPERFVQGQHGLLAEAGNAEALARAIETLLTASHRKRREMARNARCLVERHFDLRTSGKRFVELVCQAAAIRQTS